MQQLKSVFSKFLTSNLFSEDKWISVGSLAGITDEKPHKTALQDAMTSLENLVKQQKMQGPRSVPALLNQTDVSKTQ